MQLKEFLHTDALKTNPKTSAGIEPFLMHMTERHGLHQLLREFSQDDLQRIDYDVLEPEARKIVQTQLQPEVVSATGLAVNLAQLRSIRNKLWKGNSEKSVKERKCSHVEQIITLGGSLIGHDEPVHIHDACAGGGAMACILSELRRQRGLETSAECWEIQGEKKMKKLDLLQKTIAPHSTIAFRHGDVADATFSRPPDRRAFILSKHACGQATDSVLQTIARADPDSAPEEARVLTCCHGGAPLPESVADKYGISAKEWMHLAGTAHGSSGPDPYQKTIQRVAMRVTDCLRTGAIANGWRADIYELLHSSVCPRNHVIRVRPEAASK